MMIVIVKLAYTPDALAYSHFSSCFAFFYDDNHYDIYVLA